MATMTIKVVRAYDISGLGMGGICVPDMFRPLIPPTTIDVSKLSEAMEKVEAIGKEYHQNHPNESFMLTLSLRAGRAPNGFKKMDTGTGSPFCKWLKREPEKLKK